MVDIIRKTDKISDVENLLQAHGVSLGHGWALIIGMMLTDCNHLEIHGFGNNAYFNKIREDNK